MTDDPEGKVGTEGEHLLPLLESGMLNGVLSVLQDMTGLLVRAEDAESGSLTLSGANLSTMRTRILKEVERHEARVFDTTGQTDTTPADHDEIRASIGRRLDRIRDTRGTG